MARDRKHKAGKTQPDHGERVALALTILGAMVATSVAIVQGRPTSALAFTAVFVSAMVYGLVRLWRLRLPDGTWKYGWQRWALSASALVIVTGAGVIVAIPGGRSFLVHSFYGFPRETATVQSLGVSVATSPRYYRVFVPIENTSQSDLTVGRLDISVGQPTEIGCAEVPYYIYKLQNVLIVRTSGGNAKGAVTAESGAASGFAVPSIGQWSGGCGGTLVRLTFMPPALILPKHLATTVIIDIPSRLDVTFENYPLKKPAHTQVSFPDPAGVDFIAFRVTVTIGDGTKIDACYMMPFGSSRVRQGPRSCNLRIKGARVFW